MMIKELIWKDIPNFEGLYQINEKGEVKDLNRNYIRKNSISTTGYYSIRLRKNKKYKNFLIHRLIALLFIPNPNKYPIINHKDSNRLNNDIDNIEWCTHKQNTKAMIDQERNIAPWKDKKGKLNHRSKPVLQFDRDMNFIKEWENAMEIQRELGFLAGNVSACCRGNKNYSYAYGFIWKYKN